MFLSHYIFSQLITDRPDQTEAAAVVPKNHVQWEAGTFLEITQSENRWIANTNLFRYGLTSKFELRLVTHLTRINSLVDNKISWNIPNIELGFKYRFSNKGVKIVYLGHFIVPSDGNADQNQSEIVNKICIAHDIIDRISIGYNLGYNYELENKINTLTYSASIGFSLTKRVGFFSEIYGQFLPYSDSHSIFYDHGFTYLVNNNLQFDFSMGVQIQENYSFYSTGISWLISD